MCCVFWTQKENVDLLLRLRFRGVAKHPTCYIRVKAHANRREHPCLYSCMFLGFWRNFGNKNQSGRFILYVFLSFLFYVIGGTLIVSGFKFQAFGFKLVVAITGAKIINSSDISKYFTNWLQRNSFFFQPQIINGCCSCSFLWRIKSCWYLRTRASRHR